MTDNLIITISRQYGSDGKIVAKKLSEKLGIEYYDKEIIKLSAKEYGISEEMFEIADEMPSNSFLYSLSMGAGGFSGGSNFADALSNDKLFIMQSKVIKQLADKSSCIIVGRCADYILREYPNTVNVFLHASEEYRKLKIMNMFG